MSTKARLISTISAVCMILALLVTGVWAVSTANVTLGGTVTFTADNIHATITGSITGTQETVSITPLVYDADTVPSDEDKATWNNDVNFGTGNLITMKVKIKNESSERSLFVKVTDNTTTSNITKTFTSTVANVGSGDTYEVIKGGEIEYTLTLAVAELDYSASATYALDVDLKDSNAKQQEDLAKAVALDENKKAGGITYSLNEETSVATITAYDGSCNDNVVIPGYVSYEGKVYNVTTVSATTEYASYFTSATKVTIEKGVTVIDSMAFASCTSLQSIALPSTISSIGGHAFDGAGLTSITIPAGANVQTEAFYCCKSLKSAILETGFTSIGQGMFYGCSELESVTIPSTVKTISLQAFYQCSKLANIEIPSSVEGLGAEAFNGCTSLTSLIIPNVTTLDASVFSGCTSLTSIVIPLTVRAIWGPLDGCGNLKDVYYTGTEEQWTAIEKTVDFGTATIHYNYVAE